MLAMQTEDTTDYVNADRPVEANQQQAEPGPPPYESVMMSGYDGVGSTSCSVLSKRSEIRTQSLPCVNKTQDLEQI